MAIINGAVVLIVALAVALFIIQKITEGDSDG